MSSNGEPLKTHTKPTSTWNDYWVLARMHKFPLGNILVFWPCAWGYTMAAYRYGLSFPELFSGTLVFALGSTLVHSAACVLNDICDIDFDRQVERTKNRPLASGRVSVFAATCLLSMLVAASLSIMQLGNPLSAWYGVFGIAPLHALYPLMKRWTWWPQAWLGLAMNWGYHVAWVTIAGKPDAEINWIFFAGTVCWTILYDTIYGCQDRKDDIKAGVKSTALLFGDMVRPILAGFGLCFVACMAYSGYLNNQGTAYFLISCGGALLHILWQLTTLDVNSPADCGAKFESNGNMGYIIWGGMVLDYYLKAKGVYAS